jgi:leucine dehydrogenase
MQTLIQQWAGEAVVTTYDQPTGTWVFIAIHDTTLGSAMGGCRIKSYPTPMDGLRDAMRLAEGMTHKWAAIGFDLGGGKSVLAVPRPLMGEERRGLLRRFGALIASLRGLYACGPDLGSTPSDMAVIGEETEHVHGYDRATGRLLDPGPYTALGVYSGLRAALRQVFSSDEMQGRSILVQGVGDVGEPLARMLAEAGAVVLLSDSDDSKATQLGRQLGAACVASDAVYKTQCDVYAPCAVGATLNAETIQRLACRIVAGSANNQLAEDADADRLHERGILYAPDYVINAGGATALPLLGTGHEAAKVRERIRGFETTLGEIFDEARSRRESPLHAAQRRVERVLATRRAETRSTTQ